MVKDMTWEEVLRHPGLADILKEGIGVLANKQLLNTARMRLKEKDIEGIKKNPLLQKAIFVGLGRFHNQTPLSPTSDNKYLVNVDNENYLGSEFMKWKYGKIAFPFHMIRRPFLHPVFRYFEGENIYNFLKKKEEERGFGNNHYHGFGEALAAINKDIIHHDVTNQVQKDAVLSYHFAPSKLNASREMADALIHANAKFNLGTEDGQWAFARGVRELSLNLPGDKLKQLLGEKPHDFMDLVKTAADHHPRFGYVLSVLKRSRPRADYGYSKRLHNLLANNPRGFAEMISSSYDLLKDTGNAKIYRDFLKMRAEKLGEGNLTKGRKLIGEQLETNPVAHIESFKTYFKEEQSRREREKEVKAQSKIMIIERRRERAEIEAKKAAAKKEKERKAIERKRELEAREAKKAARKKEKERQGDLF